MFGYVRPDVPELKIKEFQRFKACYCGMCHVLGKVYGIPARFILNYDFVFLSMILDEHTSAPEYELKKCPMSPFCKKCVCSCNTVLERTSGYSVILAYWKLCDSIVDEDCWSKLKAYAAKLGLSSAYKKASKMYPEFVSNVKEHLEGLKKLEDEGVCSVDAAADKFASLLSCAANGSGDLNLIRIRSQILYHLGRIIYIADAYQDIDEDIKAKRFNPIVSKYNLTSADMPTEVKNNIRLTLQNSQDIILSDYELLPKNYWDSIIRNILCDAIPDMCSKVLDNNYSTKIRGLPKYPNPQIGGNK